MGQQILSETLNDRGIRAFVGKEHLALHEVHKQADTITLPPSAAARSGDSPCRHPGLDEGLMMKKNQMPPNLLLGVVGLTARLPAARTVEPAAFGKINHNGQLALYRVKFNCRWSI